MNTSDNLITLISESYDAGDSRDSIVAKCIAANGPSDDTLYVIHSRIGVAMSTLRRVRDEIVARNERDEHAAIERDRIAYVEIERDAMPAHSFRYGQLASIERVDAPLDAWLVCTECAHFDGDSTTDFSIVLVAHFVVSDESEARRIATEITDRGTTLVRPAKTTTPAATYATYDDAKAALDTAALDVAADMGEDAVEAGWGDLVRSIASECAPDVAADLIRRNA